jgi:hypothetical protein
MKSRFSLSLVLQLLFAVGTFAVTKIIPTTPGIGATTAQFYSGDSPYFDGPKLDFVNGTSFDWWYFDAVSSDGTYQLTVTFYTTVATTLGFATGFGTTNFVTFTAAYPNGTEYQQFGFAGPVTVSDGLFGIEGNWTGTGFSFTGTADLSYYRIDIDSPSLGIDGSFTFNSVCVLNPRKFSVSGQNIVRIEGMCAETDFIPDCTSSLPSKSLYSRRKCLVASVTGHRMGQRNS